MKDTQRTVCQQTFSKRFAKGSSSDMRKMTWEENLEHQEQRNIENGKHLVNIIDYFPLEF